MAEKIAKLALFVKKKIAKFHWKSGTTNKLLTVYVLMEICHQRSKLLGPRCIISEIVIFFLFRAEDVVVVGAVAINGVQKGKSQLFQAQPLILEP